MGFACVDLFVDPDSQLHSSHAHILATWGHYIYQALIYENVLPKEANPFIHNCQGCSYKLVCLLAQRFNYKLSTNQALYLMQPLQTREEAYDDYVLCVMFYYDHAAWLQDSVHDLNDTLIQDMFILNMYNSRGLFQRVQIERTSGTDTQKDLFLQS